MSVFKRCWHCGKLWDQFPLCCPSCAEELEEKKKREQERYELKPYEPGSHRPAFVSDRHP
jgi:hypothetical protein